MITKKQSKEFNYEIQSILEEHHCITKIDNNRYELNDFECGKLTIAIPEQQDFIYTVFTKFENPKFAPVFCNPHSGKYNFHEANSKTLLKNFVGFITLMCAGN